MAIGGNVSGGGKQSYINKITHKRFIGGWHQYTVWLQHGLNYSWWEIIAGADSMADADLSPIMTAQLKTSRGVPMDLMAAYIKSGSRFSETKDLTWDAGNMLSIGGISDALGCPTIITWFNQGDVFGITTKEKLSSDQVRRYAETVVEKKAWEARRTQKRRRRREELPCRKHTQHRLRRHKKGHLLPDGCRRERNVPAGGFRR